MRVTTFGRGCISRKDKVVAGAPSRVASYLRGKKTTTDSRANRRPGKEKRVEKVKLQKLRKRLRNLTSF